MPSVPLLRRASPFRDAVEEYLLTLATERRSPQTLAFYRGVLGRFLRHLDEQGVSPSTQANYLRRVKTWLKWLAEEGGYGVDLAASARAKAPRVVKEQPRPFSDEEIGRLFAACERGMWRGRRLRAILAILLDTGVRTSELCGLWLCVVELHADHAAIYVRAVTDKSRKGRDIALGLRGRLELQRWWSRQRGGEDADRRPESPLFPAQLGRPLRLRALDQLFKRLGARAGVPDCHPHRCRHTYAIMALRAGQNPFTVMHTLGHTDLTMTRRYMLIVDADVSEDKRAKSPLDALKVKF